jgi:hypothetical protein
MSNPKVSKAVDFTIIYHNLEEKDILKRQLTQANAELDEYKEALKVIGDGNCWGVETYETKYGLDKNQNGWGNRLETIARYVIDKYKPKLDHPVGAKELLEDALRWIDKCKDSPFGINKFVYKVSQFLKDRDND